MGRIVHIEVPCKNCQEQPSSHLPPKPKEPQMFLWHHQGKEAMPHALVVIKGVESPSSTKNLSKPIVSILLAQEKTFFDLLQIVCRELDVCGWCTRKLRQMLEMRTTSRFSKWGWEKSIDSLALVRKEKTCLQARGDWEDDKLVYAVFSTSLVQAFNSIEHTCTGGVGEMAFRNAIAW